MRPFASRLKASTALASLAAVFAASGPVAAQGLGCTLTGTDFVCTPGLYAGSIGGRMDDLSIRFLPGTTIVAPPNGSAIINGYWAGTGSWQSVILGDSGVAIRPVGTNAAAVVIDAYAPSKAVGARVTGRIDVNSATIGGSSPAVAVGASGDAVVDISGRIRTSGPIANGLDVRSWNGNIDVRSTAEITTTGNGSTAVLIERRDPRGPIWVDQNGILYDVRTEPQISDPDVSGVNFAPVTRGSVDVRLSGPVSVQGGGFSTDPKQPSVPANGVVVRNQKGDVNLRVGDLTMGTPTRSAPGVGIVASAADGNINLDIDGRLSLHGAAIGVVAEAKRGKVTLRAPQPVVVDSGLPTIIQTRSGSFDIALGDITMTNVNPDAGIYSAQPRAIFTMQEGGEVSLLTAGKIDISTFNAKAILADVRNADFVFDKITMSGGSAKGVFLSNNFAMLDYPYGAGPARASLTGPIEQSGKDAWGVFFDSYIDLSVHSDITQTGTGSAGIIGYSYAGPAFTLTSTGNITSSGDNSTGIQIQHFALYPDPDQAIRVRSDGHITMTGANATGAQLEAFVKPGSTDFGGDSPVAATFNGDVRSTGAGGRAVQVSGSDVALTLNGTTLGGTDSARQTGAGVIAEARNTLTLTNGGTLSAASLRALELTAHNGPVTVLNTGTVAGSVSMLGGGGALFRNDGMLLTSGLVSSPGGLVRNAGFLGLAGAAPGGMDVTVQAGLENAGVISLVNKAPGDRMTIGNVATGDARGYAGTGSATLMIDAALKAGGLADSLRLTAPASGATRIAVANTAPVGSTLTPTFLPVVTGATGTPASAFSLSGGKIVTGFTDWTLEKRGDQFGLASAVNSGRAGDAARTGVRAVDIFNLATPPGADGSGGGGGTVNSAILSFAPAPSAPAGYPSALLNLDADLSGGNPARSATPVVYMGGARQQARADGDSTIASAVYGGLDVVWGPMKGPAPRFTAGVFGGYSFGQASMAGATRSVVDAGTVGLRARFDIDGWFAGAAARAGTGEIKYTIPAAQGSGRLNFAAIDAYAGRRFDLGAGWYVEPALRTSYAAGRSVTFDVGGTPMRLDATSWRYGGDLRLGRSGIAIGPGGWTMDSWLSGGVMQEARGGATQLGILSLAPKSASATWSYGGGLAVKAPADALTMRLGAVGQAGGARSFTVYGGVSVPFGG